MSNHPKVRFRPLALVTAAVFLAACGEKPITGPEEAEAPAPRFSQAADVEEASHFLVAFDGSAASLTAAVESRGGTVDRLHEQIGWAQVSGLDDAAAADLASEDEIGSVTRDLILQWVPKAESFSVESQDADPEGHIIADPTTAFFFPCQWNMSQANCPAAWAAGEFGAGVKVAVLDTGTDPFHIDLAGRIDIANSVSMLSNPSVCDLFVPDQATFNDFNFHGAFVSGIVAANGIGVTGVAPDATIVGVKVLSCVGSGSFADVIAGILYAASVPGVEVINMSLGAYFPKDLPGGGQLVGALAKAVNFANTQGVLVVSSAGNQGSDLDKDQNFTHLPSQAGSGIGAWAGDIDGGLASYSNHGRSGAWVGAGGGDNTPGSPQIPLPGCLLPAFGHDGIISVCSTTSLFFGCGSGGNFLFNGSGTSFSAPLVSGVAALVDGKYGGSLNGNQIKTILSQTADDLGKKGVDNIFSHGRVNAGRAVN